jgi:hypothetical protein
MPSSAAGAMGPLHVNSLVGDLVPGSSEGGGAVWLVDIVVLPMGLQTPSSPSRTGVLIGRGFNIHL